LIYGIGTDILNVERINHMSKKMGWALAHQVLGPAELEVYASMMDMPETAISYLARRFAAKEAFIKAVNEPGLDMREVQVVNDERGKPLLKLSGKAKLNFGNWRHHVTISDSDRYVVAHVISEERHG